MSKLLLEKDKRVETLLVITFNPSHTNINNEVYAPFKIMSTLIRCLDNETLSSRTVDLKNGDSSKKDQSGFKMPRTNDNADDNERLDTIGGDDDNYDGNFFENEKENEEDEMEDVYQKEENLIEVDLEKIRDDEEMDIEKRFQVIYFLRIFF